MMNAGHGCVGPPYRQVVGWLDRCKLVGTGPRGRIVDQAGRWVDSPRPDSSFARGGAGFLD